MIARVSRKRFTGLGQPFLAGNRVENSHLPFRRRERAIFTFRRMKALQKFASVRANVHNHFDLERHLVDRQT
jgi:putative transposase